jgi:hypothetical protein
MFDLAGRKRGGVAYLGLGQQPCRGLLEGISDSCQRFLAHGH